MVTLVDTLVRSLTSSDLMSKCPHERYRSQTQIGLSECAEVSVPDEQVGLKGVDVVDDYNCDILETKHWYRLKNTHMIIPDTAPPFHFCLFCYCHTSWC